MFRITVAMIAVFSLGAGLLTVSTAQAAQGPDVAATVAQEPSTAGIVQTADLSKFDPGNIISDAVFFNSSTMSEAQIQAFLQARVPSCQSGYTCLKDWYDTSRSTTADAMCGAYQGGTRERASTIIYKVSQACGINPQVILATLQKEQGLVTHTWPSVTRYTIAMGQGCPDTAACDTRYYGFFNQVFGAAWQLKRYANPPGTSNYFNWYAPGRTWNVRYHPNAACGSSPVYIQNQATANLYYYTPYQPNTAALNAGYAAANDACSSYGNRNFYNYFTDWFGSTHAMGIILSVGNDIHIVSGGRRYHIPPDAWPELRLSFGSPTPVTSAYLERYADGGVASLVVRNSSTGAISYIQSGQVHYFDSCELIAVWGGNCASVMDLAAADIDKLPVGGRMSTFGRLAAGGPIHQMTGTRLVRMYDDAVAATFNGGSVPYAAILPTGLASRFTVEPRTRFATARFIQFAGDSRVWLPTADGRLIYLPSWALAREYGLPTTVFSSGVPTSAALNWPQVGSLQLLVSCGSSVFAAAGGTLHPVSGGTTGFVVTALDDATCAALRKANEAASAVFVGPQGSASIYHASGGGYRHVASVTQLQQLSGSPSPRVLRVSAETFSGLPVGPAYLVTGSMVKTASRNSVYFVDGARLVHLPTFDLAREAGLQTMTRIVSDVTITSNVVASSPLTPFVRCAGALYVAAGGQFARVASGDAGGNLVTDLDPTTCATLQLTGATIAGAVFVTDGSRWAQATRGGWVRSDAAGAAAANGGVAPDARQVSAAFLSWLPAAV